MHAIKPRATAPPLNEERLHELALRYVGKYATTRAKLRAYLDAQAPRARMGRRRASPTSTRSPSDSPSSAMSTTLPTRSAKSRSLSARGYGKRRLTEQLRRPASTRTTARSRTRMPMTRRSKPRCASPRGGGSDRSRRSAADPRQREKWIAAMVRAGHGFALARAILRA